MGDREMAQHCAHLAQVRDVQPRTPDGCEECLKTGGRWVHLRLCQECGHVGCCDNSPGKHATRHFHATQHALMRSFEAAELSGEERDFLATLPTSLIRELDGTPCLLVHATPSDPLYRYLGPDPTAWEPETGSLDVDAVLVGHTHLQFELALGRTRVLNP